MSRLRLLALVPFLAAALASPSPAAAARSWAQPEIRLVVAHGLMARNVATFRPQAVLTQVALRDLVAGLTEQPPETVANPSAPVTMAQLDARLVRALDLSAEATSFYDEALLAGLQPARELASLDPRSDAFGFTRAALGRERNRAVHAMAEAADLVDGFLAG